MTNSETAKRWVQQMCNNMSSSRSFGSKTLRAHDNIIYSYATPIAIYDRSTGGFVCNNHKYSRTTLRHQNHIIYEITGSGKEYILKDRDGFQEWYSNIKYSS